MIARREDVPESFDDEEPTAPPFSGRLFVREPGWVVMHKVGSVKEFCYMTAPGQDYYHRLLDGEIYLQRGEEKLCLWCADRRGLLTHEPKRLGERPLEASAIDPADGPPSSFDVAPPTH
jgi:hypothetical protein